MIIHCIRHGQSIYNAEGRIQGQSDVPLSDLGITQGQAAADAVARLPIDALYSSPLRRAMQTAEAVSAAVGLPIETDDRLKEIHAGIFQDKRRCDIEDLYPEETAHWISQDPDYVIPGGESRRQLMDRGMAAFHEIARRDHSQVVVVAHGRLMVVTLKGLLNIPAGQPPFSLENGSITTLEANGDGRFTLIELDAVEHLSDVGRGGSGDL
jgi:broad specificity phosphatase PhoE